jgi:hypothetical protein
VQVQAEIELYLQAPMAMHPLVRAEIVEGGGTSKRRSAVTRRTSEGLPAVGEADDEFAREAGEKDQLDEKNGGCCAAQSDHLPS